MRPIVKYRGVPSLRNPKHPDFNSRYNGPMTRLGKDIQKKFDEIDGIEVEENQSNLEIEEPMVKNRQKWRRRKDSKHKFKIKELRPLKRSRKNIKR